MWQHVAWDHLAVFQLEISEVDGAEDDALLLYVQPHEPDYRALGTAERREVTRRVGVTRGLLALDEQISQSKRRHGTWRAGRFLTAFCALGGGWWAELTCAIDCNAAGLELTGAALLRVLRGVSVAASFTALLKNGHGAPVALHKRLVDAAMSNLTPWLNASVVSPENAIGENAAGITLALASDAGAPAGGWRLVAASGKLAMCNPATLYFADAIVALLLAKEWNVGQLAGPGGKAWPCNLSCHSTTDGARLVVAGLGEAVDAPRCNANLDKLVGPWERQRKAVAQVGAGCPAAFRWMTQVWDASGAHRLVAHSPGLSASVVSLLYALVTVAVRAHEDAAGLENACRLYGHVVGADGDAAGSWLVRCLGEQLRLRRLKVLILGRSQAGQAQQWGVYWPTGDEAQRQELFALFDSQARQLVDVLGLDSLESGAF